MNELKCKSFLKQIFFQAFADENFYFLSKKLGVNFQAWPEFYEFKICKEFDKIASEKSHSVAVFKTEIDLNSENFKNPITEQEIKLFYSDYLNFIRAIELSRAIQQNPSKASSLCENFINNKTSSAKVFSLNESVELFVKENETKISNNTQNIIIKDFEILSNLINGFNAGRVTIVTAHSGFGKSNLAINLIKNAIRSNLKSLCVNMEMELFDITKRFLQSEYLMKQKEFDSMDYVSKIAKNTDSWMQKGESSFFTDGSSLSLNEIQSLASELNRKYKIDLLFVDYDQKIMTDFDSETEEWKFIQKTVEALEAIAKREKFHVVLFSQTDEEKNGMPRASKRAIQPASSVIYFHKNEDEQPIFSFIKNRFGPTNIKILVNYDPSTSFISENKILEAPVLPKPQSAFKRRQDVFG